MTDDPKIKEIDLGKIDLQQEYHSIIDFCNNHAQISLSQISSLIMISCALELLQEKIGAVEFHNVMGRAIIMAMPEIAKTGQMARKIQSTPDVQTH